MALPKLEELHFDHNEMGDEGLEALAKSFHILARNSDNMTVKGASLHSLDLSCIECTDQGPRALFSAPCFFSVFDA